MIRGYEHRRELGRGISHHLGDRTTLDMERCNDGGGRISWPTNLRIIQFHYAAQAAMDFAEPRFTAFLDEAIEPYTDLRSLRGLRDREVNLVTQYDGEENNDLYVFTQRPTWDARTAEGAIRFHTFPSDQKLYALIEATGSVATVSFLETSALVEGAKEFFQPAGVSA